MLNVGSLVGALLVCWSAAGCGTEAGFAPFSPPVPAQPYVDRPFLQEENHTTNELEPGIGALVAVALPPPEASGFEVPTQVTPRGLVGRDGQGAPRIASIPAADPDLIAASFLGAELLLAGPRGLYRCGPAACAASDPAPAGLTVLGLAPAATSTRVYVLTDVGLGWLDAGGAVRWPAPGGASVTAALERGDDLLLAGPAGLAAHPRPAGDTLGAARWTFTAADGLAAGRIAALVADVTLPQALDLVAVGDAGLQGLSLAGAAPQVVEVPLFAADRVPLDRPTAATRAADGGLLVATRGGACRVMERGLGPEWRVYNAERWLPDGDVRGLAADPRLADGPLYFATAGGLARVTARRLTLEEKLAPFVERVVLRHDRDGAVADSHLTRRGDLSSNIPWDSDNDGGWTAYWLLAECFRYQVTGDPAAKQHFDRSLERMLSLQTLTGTDYFLARAVIRKQGCPLDDCDGPDDGEWFTSPDGEWWVKGDTSNDEVTSHMFMMGHAYELCADGEQRAQIRQHVSRIVGGLLDHGYQLLDVDGLVTTYGQFDPAYVNDSLPGKYGDGGHRSAQLLACLVLAYYMTGEARYLEAERLLVREHHYDTNVLTEADYPFRAGNGDGDELGTQAFFVLVRFEQDPALRATWLAGWENTYRHLVLQQGAFWDLAHAVIGGAAPRFEEAGRWLRLAPVDFIRWEMRNLQRRDLVAAPDYYHDSGRMRSDGRILPYDERPNDRWNTDQFKVEGGLGPFIEMDGADVLMPYWMGRHYGMIIPE
ncbi:MAG TPA: hypothetical protein PK668_26490 [Myxococcota bacterium]|nr:hypothetical protein [Myxococcota bacterium]HRY97077.1 hypothetical protein [Myxococcota bacterium]HSA21116.1 hypothetical protein [Myxococcota bacterium]